MGKHGAHGVDGDWKNFEIRIATQNDIGILKKHLRDNFYLDEPLCNCSGYTEEFAEEFDRVWTPFIAQQLTLIAFDKDVSKVAGVRVTFDHTQDFSLSTETWTTSTMKMILYFLEELEKQARIFETFKVQNYAEFFLISVDRAYRNRGLAGELYRRSLILLKANNFSMVKCVFTNPLSRQAGKRVGFQELATMNFVDGVDENGEKYLPNAQPEQTLTLEVLLL